MTNKEQFIFEIENLLKEDVDFFSVEALAFFEALKNGKEVSGETTEVGAKILKWLQNNSTQPEQYFSSKIIGEGLFTSSRAVSASARKLIIDGYLTKEGQKPVTYALTSKGWSYGL
jgi:hypothetical protein